MTKEAIFKRIALDDGYVTDKSMFAVEDDRELVYKAMDVYAKQQAIAFAIDYAKRKLKWLKELRQQPNPDDLENDRMEVGYDQFIEQQNKGNESNTSR